jgi:hypothetical protein
LDRKIEGNPANERLISVDINRIVITFVVIPLELVELSGIENPTLQSKGNALMKKIKTVFAIDRELRRATENVQVAWVLNGEGVATIKFDGTSCLAEEGRLFKRFDAKNGKAPPAGFVPVEDAPDPVTGHWPGWVAVSEVAPEDKWHREAFAAGPFENGTYELVGPKVQKNRYDRAAHELIRHGSVVVEVERTRDGMIRWLEEHVHEGLVFHHEDGRMAKLRRKDFGIKW